MSFTNRQLATDEVQSTLQYVIHSTVRSRYDYIKTIYGDMCGRRLLQPVAVKNCCKRNVWFTLRLIDAYIAHGAKLGLHDYFFFANLQDVNLRFYSFKHCVFCFFSILIIKIIITTTMQFSFVFVSVSKSSIIIYSPSFNFSSVTISKL